MEFHRLYALVHDRISSLMRRVDREYVGLHVRRRRLLYSILPSYCSDRQSSREYPEMKFMLSTDVRLKKLHSFNRYSIFS